MPASAGGAHYSAEDRRVANEEAQHWDKLQMEKSTSDIQHGHALAVNAINQLHFTRDPRVQMVAEKFTKADMANYGEMTRKGDEELAKMGLGASTDASLALTSMVSGEPVNVTYYVSEDCFVREHAHAMIHAEDNGDEDSKDKARESLNLRLLALGLYEEQDREEQIEALQEYYNSERQELADDRQRKYPAADIPDWKPFSVDEARRTHEQLYDRQRQARRR